MGQGESNTGTKPLLEAVMLETLPQSVRRCGRLAQRRACGGNAYRAVLSARTRCAGMAMHKAEKCFFVRAADMRQKPAYEIPRALHLQREAFTSANGFLTPTEKIKRHHLQKVYQPILQNLYRRAESRVQELSF